MGPKAALILEKPITTELNFSNFDPTIILRLHSLLSGIDIFHLTEKYDYNIFKGELRVISLIIPSDLKSLINNLQSSDKEKVIQDWHRSQEVKLCAWTSTQTEIYLFSLTEACKNNPESIQVNMHFDAVPPFCA